MTPSSRQWLHGHEAGRDWLSSLASSRRRFALLSQISVCLLVIILVQLNATNSLFQLWSAWPFQHCSLARGLCCGSFDLWYEFAIEEQLPHSAAADLWVLSRLRKDYSNKNHIGSRRHELKAPRIAMQIEWSDVFLLYRSTHHPSFV